MISDELKYRIREAFVHVPTLRGSAGTGKTTLAAAMVRALLSLNQALVLLAPTGRAAKVFSLYAEHPAYTLQQGSRHAIHCR